MYWSVTLHTKVL